MNFSINFRGRPRTVSLDSESKIPKKRKKKRPMKFVDDLEANSDFSNDELEQDQDNQADLVQQQQPKSIVTCTVTTGLTQNGVNGSLLGFTLSIPSTSLTSTPVSTLSQNGISNVKTKETTSKLALNQINNFENNPSKTSTTVQDVDEDYDDC